MSLNTFLRGKQRRAFSEAFNKGQGLNKFDRAFVQETAENPGRRFVYMLLLGIMIAASIFLAMFFMKVPAETSDLVYKILMYGTLMGLILGAVFIVGIVAEFMEKRFVAANKIAECVGAGGSQAECDERVTCESTGCKKKFSSQPSKRT